MPGVRRRAVWLVFGAFLAAALLALGSGTPAAEANAVKNGGAVCWVTGQLGKEEQDDQHHDFRHTHNQQGNRGYGGDGEYVLDIQDFWRAVPLTDQSLVPEKGLLGLEPDKQEDFGYFSNFAQAIDFTFAMSSQDLKRFPLDTRGSDLQRLVAPADGESPERPNPAGGRLRIPWETQRSYAHRRAVASSESPWRVQSFDAMWIDPFHPDGGIGVDWQRFAGDLLGGQTDIAAVTRTGVQAGSGNRQIVGQGSMPVMTMGGTRRVDCSGTDCTFEDNVVSGIAQAQVSQVSVDSDHGEVSDPSIGTGVRNVALPWSDETVTSTVGAVSGNLMRYQGRSGTYGSLFQEDTEEDKLYVNIVLDPEDRSDYEYRVVNQESFGNFYLRNFGQGEALWTLDDFGGEAPLAAHLRSSGGRTITAPTGTAFSGVAFDEHRGYRQPTLGRAYLPFRGGYPFRTEDNRDDDSTCPDSGECFYQAALGNDARLVGSDIDDYRNGGDWDRIRWPVNFEDMNWYLYELPVVIESGGDEFLSFFLHERGANWVMGSGYGKQSRGVTFEASPVGDSGYTNATPNCWWMDIGGEDDEIPAVPTAGNMECNDNTDALNSRITTPFAVLEPPWSSLIEGKEERVLFPFETHVRDDGTLYEFRQHQDSSADPYKYGIELVRAGVTRPEDAERALPRSLNRFVFVIDEGIHVGETNLDRSGVDAMRRYGAPINQQWRREYFSNWPNRPLNPNYPYLMVLTFYESLREGGGEKSFSLGDSSVEFDYAGTSTQITGRNIKLPERHIRRVICRAMIYPAGFHPISDDGKNWLQRVFNKAVAGVGEFIDSVKAMLQRWAVTVARFPGSSARTVMAWSCDGIGLVDTVTGSSEAAALAGGAADAAAGLGPFSSGYQLGSEVLTSACARYSMPAEATCEAGTADVVIEGDCIDLPEMLITPNVDESAYYMPPKSADADGVPFGSLADVADRGQRVQLRFYAVNAANPTPRTVGLAKLRLDFGFAWDSVDTGLYNGVTGYAVTVRPDPWAYADWTGGPPKSVDIEFLLPRQVLEHRKGGGEPIANFDGVVLGSVGGFSESVYHEISGFWVGALSSEGGYHLPLVEPYKDIDADNVAYEPLAVSGVRGDFERFNRVVSRLPFAPGYTHTFSMAPYVGRPGSPDFQVARRGREFSVSGSEAICIALSRDPVDVIPSGTLGADQRREVMDYLNCANRDRLAPRPPFTEDDYEIGLLGLASSDMCSDIFTATPPHLTWDNPIVRTGWTLMWVVAGSVLFILLVWQSFRMTFDLWLMPAPAAGFREMLPRFLAAVVLAAASLFLCKWILILCSDLTCFVAQMTGTTMWGMVGDIFVNVSESLLRFLLDDPLESIINPWRFVLRVVIVNLIALILLIGFIWLFFKVFLQMLLRVALLAMLIVFAPVAGAFYASESTAHWTKKWFSLFMGTAFQQVAVLVVIYVGVHLIGYAGNEEGDSVFGFILSMLLSLLVLVAADRVVHIVNPGWQAGSGMFAGFGQIMGMGLQAAVLIASAGAGAAMGAAGAAGGGGGGIGAVRPPGGGKDSGGTAGLGSSAPQPGGGGSDDDGTAATGAVQNLPSGDRGAEGSGGGAAPGSGGGGAMSGAMSGAVRGLHWGHGFNRFAMGLSRGQINFQPLLPRDGQRKERFERAIREQTGHEDRHSALPEQDNDARDDDDND